MKFTTSEPAPGIVIPSRRGDPTWEIALLFPRQGEWTERDYLALDTNRIVELSDGCLDVHVQVYDPVPPVRSRPGDPPWEIALLFPVQGEWTEAEYLAVEGKSNNLIELSDGCLEFLPMPTPFHQRLVRFLFKVLEAYVLAKGLGEVFFPPLPVRLWGSKFRDPDLVFLRPERVRDPHHQPQGADLAVEVVSEGDDDRERDLTTKRQEYARAGIAEYWIVDPEQQRITVLVLEGTTYREHGHFAPGQAASSVLLNGFEVRVADVFAAGQGST